MNPSIPKERENIRFLFLFFQFLLAVDSLDFLLLILDMSDGISLRMVHAGGSEEESEDNAESEQDTQSFDEDSDVIERSEDDEAQSDTQIELEQELADQLRQNQLKLNNFL